MYDSSSGLSSTSPCRTSSGTFSTAAKKVSTPVVSRHVKISCTYIHVYTFSCTHVYMHCHNEIDAYIHTNMQCMHTSTQTITYKQNYIHTRLGTRALEMYMIRQVTTKHYIQTYKYAHTYLQIHTYIHTYIHRYIHTYMHTYIPEPLRCTLSDK